MKALLLYVAGKRYVHHLALYKRHLNNAEDTSWEK